MQTPVLVCTAYDAATQTCSAQAWMVFPSVLPPLTVEQAIEIGWKIGLLWATAFTLRTVARFIWRG